jgi:molybdopterin/thiamine biosynthesis adenylyltransferase/rhodanese-related sulfurtransferase
MFARYERQIRLAAVGEDGQRRLAAATALVVGAGGLGSPVLQYLAAAGVGRVRVVDFDRVEESNLHRQVIYPSADVGRMKVEAARDRLLASNPLVTVEACPVRFSVGNADALLAGCDVVVDACDDFATRYALDDACRDRGCPLVYGAIYRFEGQVSVFHFRGGPGYRDLYPAPPRGGLAPACDDAGVLGVLPGVVGTLQATEALKVLLGIGEPLSGRLLVFDAMTMRFDEVTFAAGAVADTERWFEELSAAEVKRRRSDGWAPYVVDVRSEAEAAGTTLEFTDEVCPLDRLDGLQSRLPSGRDVLVCCRSGVRSMEACERLHHLGVRRLFSLGGGLVAWGVALDRRGGAQ